MNVNDVQQTHPIICIPRITGKITKQQVTSVFKRLAWGKIENIVIVNSNVVSSNKRSKQSSKWGFSNCKNVASYDMQWRKGECSTADACGTAHACGTADACGTAQACGTADTCHENNCIFVYLKWFQTNCANNIKEKLLNKESIKLVCNEFEFWKLYAKNRTIK